MKSREFYLMIFAICGIFAAIIFAYNNNTNIKNADQEIKKLHQYNKELLNKEQSLRETIQQDSLIIVDLQKQRSDVKTKRINREKDFNKTLDVIASTDSITDLLIGADIIRESHKDRLSHR